MKLVKKVILLKKSGIIHQGYMTKLGKYKKSWQRRYFRLYGNRQLKYSEMNAKNGPENSKGIAELKIVKCIIRISQQAFEIETDVRTWSFVCDDAASCDEWLDAICGLCECQYVHYKEQNC